jgi:lycopene beta-cyclase
MEQYDIIIAGGGAAGLSLAYHLLCSALQDCSILIIDKSPKDQNDRTWCFWTDQPTLFDDIVYRSWNQLQIVGDAGAQTFDLHRYQYQMIRGIDFYTHVQQKLAAYPNVTWQRGVVEQITDGAEAACVTVDGQTVRGTWVFDSIFRPAELKRDPRPHHHINLNFKGWEIETPDPVFNPAAATLMDFRTPQAGETRFFYLLPLSERRALVEFTAFSPDHFSHTAYEQALTTYLATTLGISEYTILSRENGVIPATDHPFPRQTGQHVYTIGTKGGQIKPSTGYAFVRIQQDSAAIVASLLERGHPFAGASNPRHYQLLDALLLQVMQSYGERIKPIFSAMFQRNPIERIFRFLDERASLREVVALTTSLPIRLFVQTLAQSLLVDRPAPRRSVLPRLSTQRG